MLLPHSPCLASGRRPVGFDASVLIWLYFKYCTESQEVIQKDRARVGSALVPPLVEDGISSKVGVARWKLDRLDSDPPP